MALVNPCVVSGLAVGGYLIYLGFPVFGGVVALLGCSVMVAPFLAGMLKQFFSGGSRGR